MLDAVRRYVEAGREALTPKRAEELARSLVREGQARKDQVARLAGDLLSWSRKSSERFRDTIRREVKRQIDRSGVATKDDIESLKRRVRKLEGGAKAPARKSADGGSTARKASRSKTTARKTAARKRTTTRRG